VSHTRWICSLGMAISFVGVTVTGQFVRRTGDGLFDIAQRSRVNVVRVIPHDSESTANEPPEGVGIVIGKSDDDQLLYVATAGHVVWPATDRDPKLSVAPSVEFSQDQGHFYAAERLPQQLPRL